MTPNSDSQPGRKPSARRRANLRPRSTPRSLFPSAGETAQETSGEAAALFKTAGHLIPDVSTQRSTLDNDGYEFAVVHFRYRFDCF